MGGRRPPVALVLLAGALLFSSACRFERRPEPDDGPAADTTAGTALPVTDGAVRDSVRAVVRAFHDALRVGDGSRVASLAVPGATVVDQEESVEWRLDPGTAAGGRLPSPLTTAGTGLGWAHAATDFVTWGDAALLVDRYTATVSGEDVPWTAVETFVLRRTPDGWKLRHVHRSRGGPGDADAAGGSLPDAER